MTMNISSGQRSGKTLLGILKAGRYCPDYCPCHPESKVLYERTHLCSDDLVERRYSLREEHSKGRPVLKRRDCPYRK